MTENNPLLTDWNTPYGLPPFAGIRVEHFVPAFEEAMRNHNAEIAAVVDSQVPPSFENTVEAIERAGRALERVASVFWALVSANSSDELREIERSMSPVLTRHYMAIASDSRLFERIDAVFEEANAAGWDGEKQRLVESYRKYFERAGARLGAEDKARMTDIKARLSELYTRFSQNVLHDENAFVLALEGEEDMAGLPDFLRHAASQTAADRGLTAKHAITLARASIDPFLQFSARRDLREKAYKAYISRGQMAEPTDNRAIIGEIVALRHERARLLGFATYADYRLDDTMAKTPAEARRLLDDVWVHARERAIEERDLLQSLARAEGQNEPLAAWDWNYYAEKRRKAQFDLDSAELKPYFQLENTIAAAFDTANRLFGVSFREVHGLPVLHPDVRTFEVLDRVGEVTGLFIGDYFQRQDKRSGAWMNSLRRQERKDGKVLPVIVNVMNFTKGKDGAPALLSLDDARTLFHEFGHGLHGLLSDVTYASLSGTSVDRDFVELPSQLFENWLLRRETLDRFARHAETGESLPAALAEAVLAAQKFNKGFTTAEYTASALLDLDLHEAAPSDALDIDAFEKEVRDRIGIPGAIELRHRPAHFLHIFGGEGYAAGYYTYLWAEVMEADGFAAFEEAGDIFDAATADRLKRFVYSSGGTMKPHDAYRAFRGSDASLAPLLEKRGLVTA